jgi:SNF2 family DNA or RNA helicase
MKLFPYQEEGVRFLLARPAALNCKNRKLLADEQGLGKTAQGIVAMKRLHAQSALIITPVSVKYNWKRQMVIWGFCDEQQIYVVRSSSDIIPLDCPYIVVNYDLLRYPTIIKQLRKRKFRVGILDEVHRLKSAAASRTNSVLGKQGIWRNCKARWGFTGTPIPNCPMEIYMLVRTQASQLIAPYVKWVDFGRYFCAGRVDRNGVRDVETGVSWNFKGASHIEELRERLAPFMLRRELKDVHRQMPKMLEEIVYLDVSIDNHPEIIAQKNDEFVCRTEPFNAEAELPGPTLRRIIAECKVPSAFEYIEDTLQSVDKLVVFTYHRKVTEGLAELSKAYNPVVLYGGINAEKKQRLVDKFIADPNTRLFYIQIIAGGEAIDGLQLVCNNVLFVEFDWSHGAMSQAKARLYRIGQKQTVYCRTLVADNTMESAMAAVLVKKGNVIHKLIATRSNPKMALEDKIDDLIVALQSNTAALNASFGAPVKSDVAAKPAKPAKPAKVEVVEDDDDDFGDDDDDDAEDVKPAKTAKPDKKAKGGVTLEDLKVACKDYVESGNGSKAGAKKIMKKIAKVENLKEVAEKHYAALKAAFDEAAEASDDDEDED